MQIAQAVALVESVYGQIPAPVKSVLVDAVIGAAKKYGAPHVARAYARGLTKSVDVAAAHLVDALPAGPDRAAKAASLIDGIVKQSREAATKVGDAVEAYAPIALAVELARGNADELAKARAARKAWHAAQTPEVQAALDQLIGGAN